jgi:hypothetical protein
VLLFVQVVVRDMWFWVWERCGVVVDEKKADLGIILFFHRCTATYDRPQDRWESYQWLLARRESRRAAERQIVVRK